MQEALCAKTIFVHTLGACFKSLLAIFNRLFLSNSLRFSMYNSPNVGVCIILAHRSLFPDDIKARKYLLILIENVNDLFLCKGFYPRILLKRFLRKIFYLMKGKQLNIKLGKILYCLLLVPFKVGIKTSGDFMKRNSCSNTTDRMRGASSKSHFQ